MVTVVKKTTFSGLVKDLLDDCIADNETNALEKMAGPAIHTPPGVFADRQVQVKKFRRMKKEELEKYQKCLEMHLDLFRKAKRNFDPLW